MMFPDCPICHKEWDKNNLCVYHKDCSIIHGSGSDYEQEHIIRSYSNIGYALMWYVDGRCLLWSDVFYGQMLRDLYQKILIFHMISRKKN